MTKMYKLKYFGLVGIVVLMFSCNQTKIAYINVETLMEKYEATIALEKSLAEKQAMYSRELDSLQAPFQQKLQEYYGNADKMSALNKARVERELQQEQQILQARQQEVTRLLQNENQLESEQLTKKVDSLVAEYANAKGYNLIFGTSGKGTVMYGDDALDITEEILELLNNSYSKSTK
jgi:outer membrane protein